MIKETDNKINIVLFKYSLRGGNRRILGKFIDELEIAFKDMGHIVTILDFDQYAFHKDSIRLDYTTNSDGVSIVFKDMGQTAIDFDQYGFPKDSVKVDYVINFGATLAGIPSLFKFFSDNNVIVGTLLPDPPVYIRRLLKNTPKRNVFIGMFAESFLNSYEKYIDNTRILIHLMQAGSKSVIMNSEKNIDVIMTAALRLEEVDLPDGRINQLIEEWELRETTANIVKKFANELYTKAFDNFNKTMEECIEEVILENEDIQLAMAMPELKHLLFEELYLTVDWYRRNKYRYNVVKALLDNDIKVEFWLASENKYFNEYPNFVDNGILWYHEIVEKIAESKILLQDLYPVKNGGSERVFNAMLNRTLVISNRNSFANDELIDGVNIIYYDANNLNELVEKVRFYTENYDLAQPIIENAYKLASEKHTWKNRAEELVNMYYVMKDLNETELPS
ncbi:hypothetical protein AN639_09630 [Candidatus Epulonipiscium fishelsonii]|uniref:Uncharacterized protein n=1 Tax=Candidatus Epulonipiscium fishelsonii TaxID=77094 RepID=A0ACC8XGH1_9FIRM|nr:hypothetical protein AN639_09630 [Epulopiscium sp. SCG-B05WGA-EpuloA1]ONI42571.1 hypothetical protein AN396_14015 [Epulopiscium sp. SCG-B11WGA-EpuloA1]